MKLTVEVNRTHRAVIVVDADSRDDLNEALQREDAVDDLFALLARNTDQLRVVAADGIVLSGVSEDTPATVWLESNSAFYIRD